MKRARFNQRHQKEGETVESFTTSLYSLAEHCQFGTLQEELIRDRIVVGLRDERLSEKLQLDQDLGGVRHGGWPVHVSGHRPSLWPMAAREWPMLDIRSGAV